MYIVEKTRLVLSFKLTINIILKLVIVKRFCTNEYCYVLAKLYHFCFKTLKLCCSTSTSIIKTESFTWYVEGPCTYSTVSHQMMSAVAPLALDRVASLLVESCCTLMAPCPVKDGRGFQHLRSRSCQCLDLVAVLVSSRYKTVNATRLLPLNTTDHVSSNI